MDARINRLIRDTAAQLHAVLRQTVIDAMLNTAQPAATTHAAPCRGIGHTRNAPAPGAMQRAVARVTAGERVCDAAAAEGVRRCSLSVTMMRMRRRGLLPPAAVSRAAIPAAREPSATQRAVARVAAGESQSAAARAEGIDPSGVCAAIAKARLRGEFTGRTFRVGRPARVTP